MSLSKDWLEIVSDESREENIHRDPSDEIMFYRAVAAGALNLVQENCDSNTFADMSGKGALSDDPVTNLKYHFVVTASLITRFCVEGGMPLEESFGLSDFYIKKMDRCRTGADVILLHDQMAMDFTARMMALNKHASASKQVADAIDYIYAHMLERITVEDLARAINISPTYLSRIFKQEVGVSLSDYVRQKKTDVAKNLLRFTDYTLVEIANKLSYSSQSHFIQQFRAKVGMTPKAYRDKYYMDNFHVKNREDAE